MAEGAQQNLILRIERLEQVNRRWRFTSFGSLVVILGLVVVVALLHFSQPTVQGQQVGQPKVDPQFPVDTSQTSTFYTNFCRVNITPEELILDFGLNTQMTPNPVEPVKLHQRCVMNFYTAKRLSNALAGVIQQHENTYGILELDFQKRVKPGNQVPGK